MKQIYKELPKVVVWFFYIILNLSFIFMPSLFQRVERIIGGVLIL